MTALAPDSIQTYFDIVFSYCDGWIPLRSFVEKGTGSKQPPHNIWIENDSTALEKALTFARWADEHGSAFYIIPGTVAEQGQASASDVRQMQTLLIDLDTGDIRGKQQHLIRHLGRPSLTVESGGITPEGEMKLHLYWKLSEPAEGEELRKLLECRYLLAVKAGGDTHFRSAHQPIRVAGSAYHKHAERKLARVREATRDEYHLADLCDALLDMPPFAGVEVATRNPLDFNGGRLPIAQVLTMPVREGGMDGVTRFESLSSVMGHFIRLFHKGLIGHEEAWQRICAHNETMIIPPWPIDRLKEETNRLWQKHLKKYGEPEIPQPAQSPTLRSFTLRQLLADRSPMPADLIAPRILTPGGLMVFAGAPKVGKSDFLLTLFVHLAAGEEFLGFKPLRPLRIFYLQAEVLYDYLRERSQSIVASPAFLAQAADNLCITPQVRLLLNDSGLDAVMQHVRTAFGDAPPDIIALDPIRNLFDGGKEGGENDNNAMLFFLQERVEKLRLALNPAAGTILVHHTRKITKRQFEEDPFQALSGASALRGFYSTGVLLYRPDEAQSSRQLIFELRNGPSIPSMLVDKVNGQWIATPQEDRRLVNQTYGERLDAERLRKRERILQIIYDQALQGNVYTITQFAERFENEAGLGGHENIIKKINVAATKGYIRFFRNPKEYGLPPASRSKYGFLCVEHMEVLTPDGELKPVLPTDFKHPNTGALIPLEHPHVWIYTEEKQ